MAIFQIFAKKLEKLGFVKRVRSEEDERVVNVMLTKNGEKAAVKVGDYLYKLRNEFENDEVDVNLQTIIDELKSLDQLLDNFISRSGL